MIISLIAAIAKNGVIGYKNSMPWRLKSDLQRFKKITLNSAIIMGRATWETLPGPLKNRTHIILTRDSNYKAPGESILVVNSIAQALALAKEMKHEEVFVIGGAQIYNAFLEQNLISKIYITWVLDEPEGDTFFSLDLHKWRETYSEIVEQSEKDSSKTIFNIYEKYKK